MVQEKSRKLNSKRKTHQLPKPLQTSPSNILWFWSCVFQSGADEELSIYPFCSSREIWLYRHHSISWKLTAAAWIQNGSHYVEPGLRPFLKPLRHMFLSHLRRVKKAEIPLCIICWPLTWMVMYSSHHNHGNMTSKCAFSHLWLFSILCFHAHISCLNIFQIAALFTS